MFWSEATQEKMLSAYIHTRRWTPFKLFYELAKSGAHCAASVTLAGLDTYEGALLVPCFDLLSPQEQAAIASYHKGAVLCTACPDFDPNIYNIQADVIFRDPFSDYPQTAFAFNCSLSEQAKAALRQLLATDDGTANLAGSPEHQKEPEYTLTDTLVFAKVTAGFQEALALVLKAITPAPFRINKPNIILKMQSGAYRLYLFNDSEVKYHRAFVDSRQEIRDVNIISKFPVLPPRYVDAATGNLQHISYLTLAYSA